MAATERIPLLVTPTQKALLIKKAKASKLTVNEFVRRAAEVYNPSDDDESLLRLVAQVKETTREATAALDAALKSCADSNRRIAAIEDLTARVIRLETALEIALSTRSAGGNKRLPRHGRDDRIPN